MEYSFPEIAQLLQINPDLDVGYYQSLSERKNREPSARGEYESLLPIYKYAQCPFTGINCKQPIDTFSLENTIKTLSHRIRHERAISIERDFENRPSDYLLGIHGFINLCGRTPAITISSEVPHITPWFLPEDMESYVILHALPVCEPDNGVFTPTYALFLLTYFCEDPKALVEHHYRSQVHLVKDDDSEIYYPYTLWNPPQWIDPYGEEARLYDMAHWARIGKLGYLDFTKEDLPLVIGEGTELPEIYQNIPGRKTVFTVKDGRISPGRIEIGIAKALNTVFSLFSRK